MKGDGTDPDGPEDWAEAALRDLSARGTQPLDLMAGALAFAAFDAPTERLSGYLSHLDDMVRQVGEAGAGADNAAGRLDALNHVLFGLHGYGGDHESYDDLQNANLIRVIDRRRGLPVALGILMIHLGRAQGWDMWGLDFPGHFLVRLDAGGERLIADPFHAGAVMDAAGLRALLKATAGPDAELEARNYELIADRDILLRLQNNIKLRLVQAQRVEEAASIVDGMLLLAPDRLALWRECGLLNAHIGKFRTAISAFEHYIGAESRPGPRAEIEAVLGELKAKLN